MSVMLFIANLLGISQDDINWANAMGERYGAEEKRDGRGDAARHLALGWLAKKSRIPCVAKLAIDLREHITGDVMICMDLDNNQIGYDLTAESREDAEIMIANLVDTKVAHFVSPEMSKIIRGS
jgi:hypothetical protein